LRPSSEERESEVRVKVNGVCGGRRREWKGWENKWWRLSAMALLCGTVESDERISESTGGREVWGRNSFTEEKEGWFWLKMVWTSGMKRDGDIEGLKDKE